MYRRLSTVCGVHGMVQQMCCKHSNDQLEVDLK